MSTMLEYGYDYVFDLASRLSPKEQKRLLRELPNGFSPPSKEPQESVSVEPIISREEIEEFKRIGERRQRRRSPEELEESRRRLLEVLLNCPVMTDEELQGYEDARKEINECRLAYL